MRVKTFEKHTLKKWSGRDCVWLALMVAPFAVLFLIVTVIPVLASIVLSFFQYDMINPPQFITHASKGGAFLMHQRIELIPIGIDKGHTAILCRLFNLAAQFVKIVSAAWAKSRKQNPACFALSRQLIRQ